MTVSALWPVQDAKARFSELLNQCLSDGPLTISRRGVPQAVMVSFAQWHQAIAVRPTLKELLVSDGFRFTLDAPVRGQGRHWEVAEY